MNILLLILAIVTIFGLVYAWTNNQDIGDEIISCITNTSVSIGTIALIIGVIGALLTIVDPEISIVISLLLLIAVI